jgi:glycosyltransferase involved in cell wall biosynthesis
MWWSSKKEGRDFYSQQSGSVRDKFHAEISNNVIFTGQVADVRSYLRALDVACLVPGGNEGFSNSIIEKMAMGLPLVVSDVGGNAEAVVDGYNGFVIPPNNSEKLTEALLYLAEHPGERKEMGRRSVARVRDMFTLDGMIKAYEELYESIMAG